MRRARVSIVGAGIVGLMTAFEVSRRWPDREITVFDEGPDPRSAPHLQHTFGATYSGLDARHISVTETGPWTSTGRVALVERGPDQGGWNCLHGARLTRNESAWLEEFVAIARQPAVHEGNCEQVFEINRAALVAWRQLAMDHPSLFAPTDETRRLPIVCATDVDLQSEWVTEHALDDTVSRPEQALPQSTQPLDGSLQRGEIHGSFLVDGSAFNVQSMCSLLIARLEAANIKFRWNTRIDLGSDGELNLPPGRFVWNVGSSTAPSRFLAEGGVLLQGVAGCWTSIPNRGFSQAFKLLASEPVNFINATPVGRRLVLSGGYGWVGGTQLRGGRRPRRAA